MIPIILLIFSILGDGILSIYFFNYVPFLTITSLVFIYPIFRQKKENFLPLLIITGVWYDCLYSPVFLLNTLLSLLVYVILGRCYRFQKKSIWVVFFFVLVTTSVYQGLYSFLFLIEGYSNFTWYHLFGQIIPFVLCSLVYGSLLYFCFRNKYFKKSLWF